MSLAADIGPRATRPIAATTERRVPVPDDEPMKDVAARHAAIRWQNSQT